MMTLTDVQELLEQIDQQIIVLLEERVRACEGQELTPEEELNALSHWLEEAAERSLDESKIEKIVKLVIALSRGKKEEL